MQFQKVVFLLEKMNRGGSKKNLILKRTAVTGAIMAAMAAPLIVMPTGANADLASAVESGSYGPVVSIVSPQYADVVKGKSISIDIAVQQRSNPVKALEMFVDGHIATPGWVPVKSLQSSKFNWDSTLFNNGPHKLTVRVADSAGMIGQAEITVYVNNATQGEEQTLANPALKWLGVQNGQVLKGVVNLQLEASGSFGVKYIFVMLNPVTKPDQKPALRSWMINQPPYIIPFDTTKLNDGSYVLNALAYDALSNQGMAPQLNIGISNNSINPTYFGSDGSIAAGDNNQKASASENDNTQTAPANIKTNAADAAPPANTDTSDSNSSNTSDEMSLGLPATLQLVPQQPRQEDSQSDNSASNDIDSNADNSGDLKVEVKTSAQTQPRMTALPTRVVANDAPEASSPAVQNTLPKTTLAESKLFASSVDSSASATPFVANDRPVATMAPSQMSSLPHAAKQQESKTALPVREAMLPSLLKPSNNAVLENSTRQSQPISTIINTPTPDSLLTQANLQQTGPQRYFQVNDAMSMPINAEFAVPAKVKSFAVPQFPQALLNGRSANVNAVPDKSTFNAPVVGMADANVLSRISAATSTNHISPRLMANAQIGNLPGYVAPKPVSLPRNIAPGQPLFTAPNAPTLTDSRIASANISGKSWGYQHTQSLLAQSTTPRVAFLPKFNSTPKADGLASITVSPASAKMQVSQMSQSWPAVYQAKQHERLTAIAQHYGLPVEVLAKNNHLQNGAILTAGQKIKMPRNLQVTYDGKPLQTDVSSMLVGTTSVGAFRFLFQAQGGKVTWDPTTQTVHAKNGDNEVTLTIGSDQAVVNQKTVMMDLAAFLLSGRTMVPVRLFQKSLNAQVSWDPSTGRMFMAMAG